MRRFLSVFILMLFGLSLPVAGFSANGMKEEFLLPANTVKISEEPRLIAGSEFNFTFYETSLRPDQVRSFFEMALSSAGWARNNPMDALKGVEGVNIDKSARKAFEDNPIYTRDGEVLNIMFAPEKMNDQKKINFTISSGSIDLSAAEDGKVMDFVPTLLVKPQKEPAPVYPEAKLINLVESVNSQQAVYMTEDGIGDVADFYAKNMQAYGWTLVDDKPAIGPVGGAVMEDLGKYCPSCEKQGIKMPESEMAFKELVFANEQNNKCRIGLLQVSVDGKDQASRMNFTNIMVDYAQN